MERSRKYDKEVKGKTQQPLITEEESKAGKFSKENVDEIEKTILTGIAGQSGADKTSDGVLSSSRSTHAGKPTLSLDSVAKVKTRLSQ